MNAMDQAQPDVPQPGEHEAMTVPDGIVEAIGRWCGVLILVLMLLLIGGEVITRNLFGLSWEGTDEFGGYLLVALTFASLPVCLARGGFHEMQFLRARLKPRGISVLNLVLHGASLAFVLVLLWQFSRLEMTTWNTGDVSMTGTRTPLWIPRLFMVLGSAALCVTLARLMAVSIRRLRRAA